MTFLEDEKYLAPLGRWLIAVIFIISGLAKVATPAATVAYLDAIHAPLPVLGYVLAIAIELAGSLCLILGYKVRIAAVVLTLYCFATAMMFHSAFSDQNQMMNFLKNLAMAGGLLQIAAFGAGRVSLDARRSTGKATKAA